MANVETMKNGILNAYIFTELYKYDFIKSKSFDLSTTQKDVESKIMHILKSKINQLIAEEHLEEFFYRISFKTPNLSIYLTYPSTFTKDTILRGRISDIKDTIVTGLNSSMTMQHLGPNITFSLTGISRLFNGAPNADVDIIEKLNNLVNAIMFLPQSLKLVADSMRYVEKIGEEYTHTFGDIRHFFMYRGIYRQRNAELDVANKVLQWLNLNHPEVLTTKLEFEDDKLSKEEWDKAIMKLLMSYHQYEYYDGNEIMVALCKKIINEGERLGFTR